LLPRRISAHSATNWTTIAGPFTGTIIASRGDGSHFPQLFLPTPFQLIEQPKIENQMKEMKATKPKLRLPHPRQSSRKFNDAGRLLPAGNASPKPT
jgi:hypothetical protein